MAGRACSSLLSPFRRAAGTLGIFLPRHLVCNILAVLCVLPQEFTLPSLSSRQSGLPRTMTAPCRGGGRSGHRSILVLLLASLAGSATASAVRRSVRSAVDADWSPAAPTPTAGISDKTNKWAHLRTSHRPTDAPKAPFWVDLRPRAEVSLASGPVGTNTCGFYTDDGSALSCPAGFTCTNIGNYRDCCAGGDCTSSSFSSVCLDQTDPACTSSTPGTTCCGINPQAPYCATYLWGTSETPNKLFTVFACQDKLFSGQSILYPEPPVFIMDDTPTSAVPPSTSSTSGAATTTPTQSPGGGGGSGGSSTNIGGIVGGVLGGIALVGILLLAFYWIRTRSRRQSANTAETPGGSETSPGGGHANGGPTPPVMSSPPPPSYMGGSSTVTGGVSPMTNSTTLSPEQQPLVAGMGGGGQQHHADSTDDEIKKSAIEMATSPSKYEMTTSPTYYEMPSNGVTKAELPATRYT
ncbi:hypothetical protein B0H66DRAFT_554906 [Apodospora peruviana]|uniref:Uncharacterized protein n=1 Tax=Apodospora peruviana TaxID=516989 RepID=A0AAE0ICK9_9PEZI|nr:hypothetical protein B0H66DRAFT_554906 [Apodospora peruviana]